MDVLKRENGGLYGELVASGVARSCDFNLGEGYSRRMRMMYGLFNTGYGLQRPGRAHAGFLAESVRVEAVAMHMLTYDPIAVEAISDLIDRHGIVYSFSGSESNCHQQLKMQAANLLFAAGITKGVKFECHSENGIADVFSLDPMIHIECGSTQAERAINVLSDGGDFWLLTMNQDRSEMSAIPQNGLVVFRRDKNWHAAERALHEHEQDILKRSFETLRNL